MTTHTINAQSHPGHSGEGRANFLALRQEYFFAHDTALRTCAESALDLRLGVRLENVSDDIGSVAIGVTLYAGAPEVEYEQVGAAWPRTDEWMRVDRFRLSEDELSDVLNDSRRDIYHTRASWVWEKDAAFAVEERIGFNTSKLEWFVDFSDQALPIPVSSTVFDRDPSLADVYHLPS